MCAQHIEQRRKIIADKQAYTRSEYAQLKARKARMEPKTQGTICTAQLLFTNIVWEKSIKMMYKITCRKRSVHY